ncbi:MAG: hypothetical protein ABI691_23420 [Ginsengibacter sp.]
MKPVKTLILICASLMATASLIGIIDFAKASKSGELKNLYIDDPERLTAIPFLNNEQLRRPDPPPLNSFSQAPLRQQKYTEPEYRAELKAGIEENDKLYKDRRAAAKNAAEIANRKKILPPPEINLSSFSRRDLRKGLYTESKDEKVPNDK